jgi:hypothetical protein
VQKKEQETRCSGGKEVHKIKGTRHIYTGVARSEIIYGD